jgi:hypothetical protein
MISSSGFDFGVGVWEIAGAAENTRTIETRAIYLRLDLNMMDHLYGREINQEEGVGPN